MITSDYLGLPRITSDYLDWTARMPEGGRAAAPRIYEACDAADGEWFRRSLKLPILRVTGDSTQHRTAGVRSSAEPNRRVESSMRIVSPVDNVNASEKDPSEPERRWAEPPLRPTPDSRRLSYEFVTDDGVVCPVVDWRTNASPHVPTIVFVPGLLGRNSHWDAVASGLGCVARCVCLGVPYTELRGERCSVQGVAALVETFARAHVGGPVVLVGNSIGGHVSARLAIEQPDLVSALVLLGSSGLREERVMSEFRLAPSREWLADRFGLMFHRPAQHANAVDLDLLCDMFTKRDATRSFIRLARSTRGDHLGSSLDRVRVPTLVLWGRDDVVTPRSAAEGFVRGIRGAELDWIDECGHAPMVEQPVAVSRAIRRFLESRAFPVAVTGALTAGAR